jgi:hypothetical protein
MSEEKGKIEKAAEKTGKAVGQGVKKGIGAVTSLSKGVSTKVDMTCDKCGKMMKPGGNVKKTISGVEHQFCSEACAKAWNPGDKSR